MLWARCTPDRRLGSGGASSTATSTGPISRWMNRRSRARRPMLSAFQASRYQAAMRRFTSSSVTTSHDQRWPLPLDGPRMAASRIAQIFRSGIGSGLSRRCAPVVKIASMTSSGSDLPSMITPALSLKRSPTVAHRRKPCSNPPVRPHASSPGLPPPRSSRSVVRAHRTDSSPRRSMLVLHITSSNRSHHVTGTVERRCTGAPLASRAEFEDFAPIAILAHREVCAARSQYPSLLDVADAHPVPHHPTRRPRAADRDDRSPWVIARRRRAIIARATGFDVKLGPRAVQGLEPRRFNRAA